MARQQRQNLEVVAESIAHIVWLSAPDGSTEYFNTVGTEYTALPRDANYGWGWVEMVHEEDAARARAAWVARRGRRRALGRARLHQPGGG